MKKKDMGNRGREKEKEKKKILNGQ